MLDRQKYTDAEIDRMIKSMVILTDSREQKNSHITTYLDKHNVLHKKIGMPCGDYSFMLPADPEFGIIRDKYFYNEIFIERKNSAEELSGCFTRTRTRFEEEFSLSRAKRKYLLIEGCNYFDIVEGKYNTDYGSKSFTASLHSFNSRYGLEIIFMPDPQYSAVFIVGTMQYFLRNLLK